MANYKVVDADQLDIDMKSIANAIRAKAGTTASMSFPDGYVSTIRNIEEGADLPILVNPGTDADALKDKEFINQAGEIVTGSIVSKSAANVTVSGDTVNIPSGYYPEAVSKSVANVEQSTPEISISSSGLITASSVQGSGYVTGGTRSATKQISAKSEETFVPTTKNQTISAGTYLSGTQTIAGDANLKAENIADGVTIFNIEGTHIGGIIPSGTKTVTENGVHDVTEYESVKVALPTATQATPSISVDSSGKITATVTQSTTGIVEKGTKTATKNLSTQAAKSVTPTTSNQTAVSSGKYTTGAITVKGDANLVPGNIKSGTSIFGVTGSYTEPKPTGSLTITENGTYDVIDYAKAIVSLSNILPSLISKIETGSFVLGSDCANLYYLYNNTQNPNILIIYKEDGLSATLENLALIAYVCLDIPYNGGREYGMCVYQYDSTNASSNSFSLNSPLNRDVPFHDSQYGTYAYYAIIDFYGKTMKAGVKYNYIIASLSE